MSTVVEDPVQEQTHTNPLENMVLVTLFVGRYQGRYQIPRDALELEMKGDEVQEDLVTMPQLKLIPKEWADRFTKLENEARGLLAQSKGFCINFGVALSESERELRAQARRLTPEEQREMRENRRRSYSPPLQNVYAVPIVRLKGLCDQWTAIQRRFYDAVEEFVEAWPNVVEELREGFTPEQWETVSDLLPSIHRIEEKFRMAWAVVPLEGSGHQLDQYAAEEFGEEMRAKTKELMDKAVENMMEAPRLQAQAAIKHLAKSLADSKRIKQGTIDGASRAIAMLRDLNFMHTDSFLEELRAVEGHVGGMTPQELNRLDQASARQLADQLVGYAERCTAEDTRATEAATQRNIQFDMFGDDD